MKELCNSSIVHRGLQRNGPGRSTDRAGPDLRKF